jgi:hypothetical protein
MHMLKFLEAVALATDSAPGEAFKRQRDRDSDFAYWVVDYLDARRRRWIKDALRVPHRSSVDSQIDLIVVQITDEGRTELKRLRGAS